MYGILMYYLKDIATRSATVLQTHVRQLLQFYYSVITFCAGRDHHKYVCKVIKSV